MNDIPAIQVTNLSKCYKINHKEKVAYNTVKDDFSKLLKNPFRENDNKEEEFWALKNVSFEVKKGELFGVIGSNGSGKSTLLKILSRIIDPTQGEIRINGKVASLLEVGTGFHPDLTGRENIFFNGSMLGMSRKEIEKKFKDIVDFAEVEQFIDTPVKFYSSGMYVRLAFAVAAHLDPEILILDEVLAVGDAAFQKKSLRKVQETLNDGKTVLFVSHDMSAVRQLCTRGIMLEKGQIVASGNVDSIIEAYSLETNENVLKQKRPENVGITWRNKENDNYEYFKPTKVYITDDNNKVITKNLVNNKDYWVNIEGLINKLDPMFNVGYSLWDQTGKNLLYISLCTDIEKDKWLKFELNKNNHIKGKLPANLLNTGTYRIKIISSIHAKEWLIDPDSSQVKIELNVIHGTKPSPIWVEGRGGIFAPSLTWINNQLGEK
jgi:lipopolysaccharide transport system ATP-binding protein